MATRIPAEKIMSVVSSHNLTVTEKAAWLRCEAAKDRRIYVPKSKTVGRIDLSGFEVEDTELYGVKALGGESFGGVKQQLSFDGTEEEILANLDAVLTFMSELPGVVKVKKAKATAPVLPSTEAASEPAEEAGEEILLAAADE